MLRLIIGSGFLGSIRSLVFFCAWLPCMSYRACEDSFFMQEASKQRTQRHETSQMREDHDGKCGRDAVFSFRGQVIQNATSPGLTRSRVPRFNNLNRRTVATTGHVLSFSPSPPESRHTSMRPPGSLAKRYYSTPHHALVVPSRQVTMRTI